MSYEYETEPYPEAPKGEDSLLNDMEFTHVANEGETAPKCFVFYPEEFAPEHKAKEAVDLGGFNYVDDRREITCLFCLRFDEIADKRDESKAITSPGYILQEMVYEAERGRDALFRHGVIPSSVIPQDDSVWQTVRTMELARRDRRFMRWTMMECPY